MAWDSSRPVPWQRLIREWLIYVAIMAVVLVAFFRDSGVIGAMAGLLVSGPLYIFFGFLMAKFGYQRRTLKGMKTPQAGDGGVSSSDAASTETEARRPAPTKRTSGGGNRPTSKSRRR